MATKKNENLEKYRERYQQIKEKILGLGYVCIGNVQTRYLKCGKEACSCHQSAERRKAARSNVRRNSVFSPL